MTTRIKKKDETEPVEPVKDKLETVAESPITRCLICQGQPTGFNKSPEWTDQCARCGLPVILTRVNNEPTYIFNQGLVEADGFITITPPGQTPIVRFNTNMLGKYEENYQIIYQGNIFSSGKLRCPVCNDYLCDFNGIKGDLKQRCNNGLSEAKHGRKGICRTVTRFIFINPGVGPHATIRGQ